MNLDADLCARCGNAFDPGQVCDQCGAYPLECVEARRMLKLVMHGPEGVSAELTADAGTGKASLAWNPDGTYRIEIGP